MILKLENLHKASCLLWRDGLPNQQTESSYAIFESVLSKEYRDDHYYETTSGYIIDSIFCVHPKVGRFLSRSLCSEVTLYPKIRAGTDCSFEMTGCCVWLRGQGEAGGGAARFSLPPPPPRRPCHFDEGACAAFKHNMNCKTLAQAPTEKSTNFG